jgi:hypothetical protein
MRTEEVVESITSVNPTKYRAVEECDGDDDDEGNSALAAVPDEEFHWLEPKDFVAAYRQSDHFKHVAETIASTNKHITHDEVEDKVRRLAHHRSIECLLSHHTPLAQDHPAKIELVDYGCDAKYAAPIYMYRSLNVVWRLAMTQSLTLFPPPRHSAGNIGC